jgi:hypothetical protein
MLCARSEKRASWVTIQIVAPSRCDSERNCITAAPFLAARLPVGSSASKMEGLPPSARATATRCCRPPVNWLGRRDPFCRRCKNDPARPPPAPGARRGEYSGTTAESRGFPRRSGRRVIGTVGTRNPQSVCSTRHGPWPGAGGPGIPRNKTPLPTRDRTGREARAAWIFPRRRAP